MSDFVYDNIGWVLGAVMALIVGGLVVVAKGHEENRLRFMAACQQDLKEYECVAMWRAGYRRR